MQKDLPITLNKVASYLAEHADEKRGYGSLALLLKEAAMELQDLQDKLQAAELARQELKAALALKKLGQDPGDTSPLDFFADDPELMQPGDAINSNADPMAKLYAVLQYEGG